MLGDPETPTYLSEPIKEYEDLMVYYMNDDELSIEANDNQCLIYCMSRDDNGDSYYYSTNNSTSLFDVTEEISFCVTKPGHVPFLGIYAPIVHLQNESILWDYHVYGNNVIIGQNVTNNRESGAFVVEAGKTTVEAIHEVNINDSFEVKLGAELDISVNN